MQPITHLDNNKLVFKSLLEQVDREMYLWKPSKDKWNLLELVCHLDDEEKEDFRARLKVVVNNSEKEFIPIHPEKWVVERKYGSRNYDIMVHKFLEERTASVAWLKEIDQQSLENKIEHQHFGAMSGHFIIDNWIAHDYLHLQQIMKLKFQYFENQSNHSLNYAKGL